MKYRVWEVFNESEETATEVFEDTPEEAAIEYCERQDDAATMIDTEVCVKDPEGEVTTFRISVDWDPIFFAEQI